jgi:hypothetical protein
MKAQEPRVFSLVTAGKLLPLYLLFLSTFGLAAWSKLSVPGVPAWFETQFATTFLNAFPGALALNFYLIAVLEALVATGFAVSLARREFLPGRGRAWLLSSLLLAELVFVVLGFGLRMTGDHAGAANLFFYFGATLVALWYVEASSRASA